MSGAPGGAALGHGLSVPPFGELADPVALVELAALAEARGWDGVFPWDHVQTDDPQPVADVWVVLAAMATVTDRVLLGPMVTPLPRRRPHKLAREVVTLDHLSSGRVILGLGLGVDHARELSAFGEEVGDRERGAMLDEGLELMCGLLSGEEVHHRGEHYTADGVTFLPTPVRPGGVPIWLAARTGAGGPLRRAARHDGLFIIERDPEEITAMLEVVSAHRGGLEGFEVATMVPGADPAPFVAAGVTWWMTIPGTGAGTDEVFRSVEQGPPPLSRLFLGVRPPTGLAEELVSSRHDGDSGIRWVPAEQLHVTLRFLGDATVEEVEAAMREAGLPPTTAVLGPASARMGRSVLMVPVRGVDDLADAVRRATEHIGRPPDPRGFRGHLTLARLGRRAACGVAGAAVGGSWEVGEVELVASRTDPAGAVHEVVASFPVPSHSSSGNA